MSDCTDTEIYTPDDTHLLNDAVLNAINHQTGKDLQKGEFRLFDYIDSMLNMRNVKQ